MFTITHHQNSGTYLFCKLRYVLLLVRFSQWGVSPVVFSGVLPLPLSYPDVTTVERVRVKDGERTLRSDMNYKNA